MAETIYRTPLKSHFRHNICSHYYFSLDNLCRDSYLRSYMDEEGFIPLLMLANFNRMTNLTTDFELVTAVAQNSETLECKDGFIRLREGWAQWVLPEEVCNLRLIIIFFTSFE